MCCLKFLFSVFMWNMKHLPMDWSFVCGTSFVRLYFFSAPPALFWPTNERYNFITLFTTSTKESDHTFIKYARFSMCKTQAAISVQRKTFNTYLVRIRSPIFRDNQQRKKNGNQPKKNEKEIECTHPNTYWLLHHKWYDVFKFGANGSCVIEQFSLVCSELGKNLVDHLMLVWRLLFHTIPTG